MRAALPRRMFYLGLELAIPQNVFLPASGGAFDSVVQGEVRDGDAVLDMGTGSGISAILAAKRTSNVLAVDINPLAVAAARQNAILNGVDGRIRFAVSDVFDAVEGTFDLILFNPPFRWFKARDLLELSTADENYRTLTRFMREVRRYLRPGGRILMNFGSSGDVAYLDQLIATGKFNQEILASNEVETEALRVTYNVFRLS